MDWASETHDPQSKLLTEDNRGYQIGAIFTFKQDSTFAIESDSNDYWIRYLKECKWYTYGETNLVFSKVPFTHPKFKVLFAVLSFNNDSIILYKDEIGLEGGNMLTKVVLHEHAK